ncbi:MAG: type 4a pilus biogenesis protein PilO [Thermodesulfobacteriota bacterium]
MNLPQVSIEPFIEKVESLQRGQRIAICAVSYLLPMILMAYFVYYPTYTEIETVRAEVEQVEKELENARNMAKQIDRFKKELAFVEQEFVIAKSALPEKEEIPSLLKGITTSGYMAGMTFLLFEPKPEVLRDFYAEIPVSITVAGDYHHVALFFDYISTLSRIVNIREIKMSPQKDKGLITSCIAETYKFVEEGASSTKPATKK